MRATCTVHFALLITIKTFGEVITFFKKYYPQSFGSNSAIIYT